MVSLAFGQDRDVIGKATGSMKLAERHTELERRTGPAMHHIACDCGVTFGHEPVKGLAVTCPSCKRSEEIEGADQPTR